MASFTVRVELHDAEEPDYETLWDAMKKRGFKRTIESDKGVTYSLPPAEYNLVGDLTRQEVLEKASDAAGETGRENEVLVTESKGRRWRRLAKQ